MSVRLDGEDKGRIVYAPYTLHIDAPAGEHTLELTVFGSRVNSFGALHNCNDALSWVGPSAWESRGKEFSYEYRTRRPPATGTLAARTSICRGSIWITSMC